MKNRSLVLLSILLLSFNLSSYAQIVFRKSYYEDVDSQNNGFLPTDAFQLQDGSMILCGLTGEVGTGDLFVTKTDRSGTVQWSKSYGNFRNAFIGRGILASDGNIVIVGTTTATGNAYYHIIKVNTGSGALIWSKAFETVSSGNLLQYGSDIIQTADSGFVVCGRNGNSNNYAGLFKLDKNGNQLWAKHFIVGTTATYANRMALLPGGDIIVAGRTGATAQTSTPVLARFDGSGNLIWSKTISVNGTYTGNNFNNIALLSDGNVIVSVENGNNQYAALAKIDVSAGTVVWANQYYSSSCTGCTRVNCMLEVAGGQIIVAGYYSATPDFLFKIDGGTGAYLTGKTLYTPYLNFSAPGFSMNKTLDGANLWWSSKSLYKFKDNLTTCTGSAMTLTVAAATTSSNNTTFTFSTYLNEVSAPMEVNIYITNMKLQVQSDCGGKCTTLDNLGSSFRVADFNLNICPSNTLTFTNTSITSNSSLWKIDGVPVSTTTNLSNYNFTAPGVHTVQLVAGSVSGCYDTSSTQVTVNTGCDPPPGPVGVFTRNYTNFSAGRSITQTTDGGYAFIGISNNDMAIVKVDALGNQQWAWQYGNTTANESGWYILQTLDGGYLAIGNEGAHLLLVKLNNAGSFLWSFHYRVVAPTAAGPDIMDAVELTDGSVVMAGHANTSTFINGFICRIDNLGNIIWEKHFVDVGHTYIAGMIKTTAGNFMITGNVPNGGYAMTVDQNGNLLWSRKIGGISVSRPVELSNGHFACLYASSSFVGTMKFTPLGESYFYKTYFNTQPGSFSNTTHRFMKMGVYGYVGLSIYNGGSVTTTLLDNEFNAKGTLNSSSPANMAATPTWTSDNALVLCQGTSIQKVFPFDPFVGCNNFNSIPNNATTSGYTSNPAWTPTLNSFFFDDPQTLFSTPFTLTTNANCNQSACGVVAAFTGPILACTGETINFTNTSYNGVSYNWKENGVSFATTTNATRNYVTPGTYVIRLVATGASGCKDSVQVSVVVSNGVTANAGNDVSITCGGNTTLNASGGTTYLWSPGTGLSNPSVSNPVASPTVTTSYIVAVSNGGGCTGYDTVVVTVTGAPTVTVSGTNTICAGGSTIISASGATTYTWSPATGLSATTGSSPTASPTITTTYTVTGSVGSCGGTNTFTVTVNPAPTVTISGTASICTGGNVTLTSSGAISYLWNPGNLSGSSVNVSPATTTTYTVTGTGGNGCTSTSTYTVTVNTAPTVSATANNNPICGSGSTTLTGNGANTYLWNPGNLSGTNVNVSPTITTTYTVVGTAVNGCTNTNTITINVNPVPTVTASTGNNTICAGGSTSLTGNGASTYVWNPGNLSGTNVNVTPTITTTYTVVGTGSNGCTNSSTITITVNAAPAVTASTVNNAICIGGNTTLTGNGASTYVWNPGNLSGTNVNVSPTVTTTYTVTGTGSNGCTNTNTITITVNSNPSVSASATNSTICDGSSTTLNGSGANSYTWNPGNLSGTSVSVSPTATTTYTVTGTDGNGCSNTNTITITVNANPTVSASTGNNTICTGGSTTLNGTGASSYVWNPGNLSGSSVSVSPTVTTTYTVTGTGSNGCTNTSAITITVNANPTVSASTGNNTICNGSSTTLNGNGANTYVWNPGNLTGASVSVSPTATTTYTVTGTNGSGCTNTSTITITVNPVPSVTASTGNNIICNGNSTTLNGNGATSYVWNPGNLTGASVNVSPTATTTYTVTGTDVNGCTNSGTITITVNPLPTVSATTFNNTICEGGTTVLNSGGASSYVWNPGNLIGVSVAVSPTITTTYTVTGTGSNGCTNTNTVTITVNPAPPVSASTSNNTLCSGGSTTLNGAGATTFIWNPGNLSGSSVNVSPTVTTTYTVTGTDGNGCSNTSTITITVNPNPVVSASANNNSICGSGSVTLTGTGANTYFWQPGNLFGVNVNVSPTATTTYTVIGTDGNGCTNTSTITITVSPVPTVTATANSSICMGDTLTLTANGSNSYVWNPGNLTGSSVNVNPTVTTTYTVTGTDLSGCSNTAVTTITVNPLPVVSYVETNNAVCINAPVFPLTPGTPSGGTYSGPGVSAGNFDAGTAGAGTWDIVYSFTDVNGCTDTAISQITVNLCTGETGLVSGNNAIVYPNPFADNFTVVLTTTTPAEMIMTNALGQIVGTWKLEIGNNVIDANDFANGVYFIQLRTWNSVIIKKLVKQN